MLNSNRSINFLLCYEKYIVDKFWFLDYETFEIRSFSQKSFVKNKNHNEFWCLKFFELKLIQTKANKNIENLKFQEFKIFWI